MSEWALKRFWKAADVAEAEGGFAVLLDGKSVRTPAKRALTVPTERMANAIAREWDSQEEIVDPTAMPWTRSANAALDKVAPERAGVIAHLADYAGTDLLSYRASGPETLIARQRDGWDPVLGWLAQTFGARLQTTAGVMPVAQDAADIQKLQAAMDPMTDFQLTGFYDLVTLSGSFTLALATSRERLTPDAAWGLSRLDEDWQAEQWGVDEEAAEEARVKRAAFLHATEFYHSA